MVQKKKRGFRNRQLEVVMGENGTVLDTFHETTRDLHVKQEEFSNVLNSLENKLDSIKLETSVSQTENARREGTPTALEKQKLAEFQRLLDEEKAKTAQLTSQLEDKDQLITKLSNSNEEIRNDINSKIRKIEELDKVCNDKEWSLGEHRQWLHDSRQKSEWLEGELARTKNDAQAKTEELEELRKQVAERDEEIESLSVRLNEGTTLAEHDLSPSDRELKMLQERLRAAEERAESLQDQLEDLRTQRDYLQQQLEAQVYSPAMDRGAGEKSPGIENSLFAEDVTEELIKASKKVYEKDELLKEKESELTESLERCRWLEEEKRKMGEELWLAKERVANQDRELGEVHRQLDDERNECTRLRDQIEGEKKRFAETGGVDYSKFQALKQEMEEREMRLLDEKSKVEWHLGEVNQWWNDAKWRIGELEADVSHRQWLLDQANQKAYELDAELNGLRHFRDMATEKLSGTFLIRKQPLGERTRWRLAMWTNDSPEDLEQYRRVWFEITSPGARVVTLSASFVNWECSLLCDCFDNEQGKFGVWVDIPPGRYEFRFVVDGKWVTCDNYPTVPNDFGSSNNWRYIE